MAEILLSSGRQICPRAETTPPLSRRRQEQADLPGRCGQPLESAGASTNDKKWKVKGSVRVLAAAGVAGGRQRNKAEERGSRRARRGMRVDALQGEPHAGPNSRELKVAPEGLTERWDRLKGL